MQEDERNAASPPTLVESLTTCIVGGGSSAHVLIPFLSEAGHRVHLLTRRPDDWQNGNVYCRVTHGSSGDVAETHAGRIDGKSSEAADVIPDADIIVLCMPVCKYRESLDRLAPYVSREKEVFIGTIYGQAGTSLLRLRLFVVLRLVQDNLNRASCFFFCLQDSTGWLITT
jgi:glycerol-3-phosphate dehydrogenase